MLLGLAGVGAGALAARLGVAAGALVARWLWVALLIGQIFAAPGFVLSLELACDDGGWAWHV